MSLLRVRNLQTHFDTDQGVVRAVDGDLVLGGIILEPARQRLAGERGMSGEGGSLQTQKREGEAHQETTLAQASWQGEEEH